MAGVIIGTFPEIWLILKSALHSKYLLTRKSSGLGTGCFVAPSPPKSPSPGHSLRLIERGGLSECECELVCVA